jgi:hypothetical protein
MVDNPATASSPSVLWRVGRSSNPLNFSEIGPEDAALSSGGNRFDVPGGQVLYAATKPQGAFAETLARFRPTAGMLALPPEEDEHLMAVGAIPADWRVKRQLAKFSLDQPLPFLDVDSPETHTFLTQVMAPQLEALGIPNLDVAIVRGANRFVTRAIAEWAYVAVDDEGSPVYSGLRYESRLGPHECWAIFSGVEIVRAAFEAIPRTNPDIGAVAKVFGLTVH